MEKQFKKVRVLFTIPNFDRAGGGKALLKIALNLNKKVYEPLICCSHGSGKFFETVKKSGIKIYFHKTTHSMIPRLKGLIKCFRLAKYFKSLGPDLIHSFHYGPDYSEALSSWIAGIPWVYTKKNMNWGGNSKNGWFLRSIFASRIIIQNRDMSKFFSKNNKVHFIPRGVDTSEFFPRSKCKKLIGKYCIHSNEKIILTVANLIPVKNIEILIESFQYMIISNNNLRLIIVGDTDNEYGENLISNNIDQIEKEKIIFTGKLLNVHDYLSIADVFVLPTNNVGEGSPVALLEALASGVASIGSKVPGIKDILSPFQSNLFDPNNSSDLTKKLKKLLKSNNNELVKKQLSHITKNYSIAIETSRHEEIYQSEIGS